MIPIWDISNWGIQHWSSNLKVHILDIEIKQSRLTISTQSSYLLGLLTFYQDIFIETSVMIGSYIDKVKPFSLEHQFKFMKIGGTTYIVSVFINSLINFQDRTDFKVLLRLGLRFYRSNSLILFCSPLHVHLTLQSTCCYLWFLRSNWQDSHQFLLESVRPLNLHSDT